jgi:serine/threonine protein kinase
MENENKTSLADLLRSRGNEPLAPGETLVYLKSIVASLERVHERGLVHGDIRAANVFIDSQGRVYIEGVGFAQRIGSRSVVRQPLEMVPYLAPELVSYQVVNEATDVYSLGVLLYEMLTGETPASRKGEIRAPRQMNAAVPQMLSQDVMRAMAPNSADRFQKPRAFFEAACSALNLTPDQVPDQSAPATLHLAPAPTVQAPATVVVQSPPQAPQTMVVQSPPQAPQTMVVGAAQQVLPAEPEYSEQPAGTGRSRPVWFWLGIVLLGFILLLCVGFFVGSRLPDLIAGLGASSTATWTATSLPSGTPLLSSTPVATATLAPAIPTETFTLPPPPTLEPSLTVTSPPPPTEPPAATGGDLQVRNRFPYGIFVFRERSTLNTSPIPSGMYLIFFNQPAGTHLYRFCKDLQMNECMEKEIDINGDVEVTVP